MRRGLVAQEDRTVRVELVHRRSGTSPIASQRRWQRHRPRVLRRSGREGVEVDGSVSAPVVASPGAPTNAGAEVVAGLRAGEPRAVRASRYTNASLH